jgi:hypothetical protein
MRQRGKVSPLSEVVDRLNSLSLRRWAAASFKPGSSKIAVFLMYFLLLTFEIVEYFVMIYSSKA